MNCELFVWKQSVHPLVTKSTHFYESINLKYSLKKLRTYVHMCSIDFINVQFVIPVSTDFAKKLIDLVAYPKMQSFIKHNTFIDWKMFFYLWWDDSVICKALRYVVAILGKSVCYVNCPGVTLMRGVNALREQRDRLRKRQRWQAI